MIKKIKSTRYRTSDGEVFDSKKDAEEHEAEAILDNKVEELEVTMKALIGCINNDDKEDEFLDDIMSGTDTDISVGSINELATFIYIIAKTFGPYNWTRVTEKVISLINE